MKYYRLIVNYEYMNYTFDIENADSRFKGVTDVYINNEFDCKLMFQHDNKIRVSGLKESNGKKYVSISNGNFAKETLNFMVGLNEEVHFEYHEEYNLAEDSITNSFRCTAKLIEDEWDFRIPRVLYVKKKLEIEGTDVVIGGAEISETSGEGEIVEVPKDCSNREMYEAWLKEFTESLNSK